MFPIRELSRDFDPESADQYLRRAMALDRWATPLWMAVHALCVWTGALGRRITWAGITYELRRRQDVRIVKRDDHIARTLGQRDFPWRVIVVAEKDADLLESQMIYKLAKPLQLHWFNGIKFHLSQPGPCCRPTVS